MTVKFPCAWLRCFTKCSSGTSEHLRRPASERYLKNVEYHALLFISHADITPCHKFKTAHSCSYRCPIGSGQTKFSFPLMFCGNISKFSMSLCQLLLNEALFNADGGIQRPHSSLFHKASLLLITIYRPPLSTRATHTNNMLEGRQWGVPCDENNRMSQPHRSVRVCVIDVSLQYVRQSVSWRNISFNWVKSKLGAVFIYFMCKK